MTGWKVDSLAQTREPWIVWQSAGLLMFCRWTGPTLADLMSKGNHGLAGRNGVTRIISRWLVLLIFSNTVEMRRDGGKASMGDSTSH